MTSRVRWSFILIVALCAIPVFAQNILHVDKLGSGPAVAGENYVWTIGVNNPDPAIDALDVELTDEIPAQTRFVSFVQTSGAAFTCTEPPAGAITGSVVCNISALMAGAFASFEMTVFVEPLAAGSIMNTATATSNPADPNTTDNTESPAEPVAYENDLVLTKTGPASVAAGANASYTITVRNDGPSAAQSVQVQESPPPGTEFVSWTQTSGPAFICQPFTTDGPVLCDTTTLPVGAVATFVHTVRVRPDIGLPMISNTASVNAGTPDPDSSDNSDSATTDITLEADIEITKSGPLTAVAGLPIVYDVTVTNNGPSWADFGFTDVIPAGTTFESLQGDGPTFPCIESMGTINCGLDGTYDQPGTSRTIRITLRVDSDQPQGTPITNTANTTVIGATDPDSTNNSDSTTAVVFTSADMRVTKLSAAATVAPGGNITYTINLSNPGPGDAQNITLTDVIPTGTTFVSFIQNFGPPFECTPMAPGSTGTITCTAPTFTRDNTAGFTMVVNTDSMIAGGSSIANTATVSAATGDPAMGNNNSTATVTVMAPDLEITKSDSPDPVSAGSNITYTLSVANLGSTGANAVTLTDSVPANTTFVSRSQTSGPAFSCSGPAVGSTGDVTCTNAFFAPGATATFAIVVRVDSGTPNGTVITNTADITTTDAEPDISNNTATTNTTVMTTAVLTPDLVVTKTDGPDPVQPGNNITYNITLANNGPAAASNVSLADTVPANTTFVSFAQTSGPAFSCPTAVNCTIASLASGSSATFTLIVQANAGLPSGTTITNTATASTSDTESTTANNSATTTTTTAAASFVDLTITKSDAPDPVPAGDNITYTIVVTNTGSADAVNVSLTDTIPAGTTFVSFSAPAGWTPSTPSVGGTGTVTATAASLAAATSRTFTLIVRTGAPAIVSNTASVTTDSVETSTSNNSATTTTVADDEPDTADLSIDKTASPPTALAGSNVTYTITVENEGPETATTVTVTDILPAGVTFVSADTTEGFCSGTSTINCLIGSMPSGTTETVTLVVRADAVGTIINSASVDSTSLDPSSANDTESATVQVVTAAIPALDPWGLILLAAALAAAGALFVRMQP